MVLFSLATQHAKYVLYPFHFKLFPDTGTKGVARDMKKVCSGAQRDEEKTWFSELSDKGTVMWLFEIALFVVVVSSVYLQLTFFLYC